MQKTTARYDQIRWSVKGHVHRALPSKHHIQINNAFFVILHVYKHKRKNFFILLNHFNPPMAYDKPDWFQTSWGITFAILAMLALTELCTFFTSQLINDTFFKKYYI